MVQSDSDSTTITRQELYERLWSKPAREVALELDTTLTCLRYACEAHCIPCPKNDHFRNFRRGPVPQPDPLPTVADALNGEVRLFRRHLLVGNWPAYLLKRSQEPAPPKPVAEASPSEPTKPSVRKAPKASPSLDLDLDSLHPLVSESGRRLEKAKANDEGWVPRDPTVCLDIFVTRNTLARALLIYDAFIRAWEGDGGTVSLGTWWFDKQWTTLVGFDGDELPLCMLEGFDPVEKPRDPNRSWARKEYDHVPNGRLFFRTDGYYGESERTRWSDGKVQRLELIIEDVVGGLKKLLASRRADRLKRECIARQEVAACAARRRAAERRDAEQQKAKALWAEVNAFRRAKRLRSYIATKRRTADAGEIHLPDPDALHQWCEWAAWHADSLDPLVETPPYPFPLPAPSNLPVAQMDFTSGTRELVAKLGIQNADELFQVDYQSVAAHSDTRDVSEWIEIGRVLEGLGYDIGLRRGK